jgi:hypothetical protein
MDKSGRQMQETPRLSRVSWTFLVCVRPVNGGGGGN